MVLLLVATGCSVTPSERDARTALEDQIQRDSEGRIKLISFRQTGAKRIEGGDLGYGKQQWYVVEYEAEIEFQDHVVWYRREPWSLGVRGWAEEVYGVPASRVLRFIARKPEKPKPGGLVLELPVFVEGEEYRPGERVKISGVVIFFRHPNEAWRPVE